MAEEHIILLGDLVMKKMTLGQSTQLYHLFDTILIDESQNYDPLIFNKMKALLSFGTSGLGPVRQFLSNEGYIEEVNPGLPTDKLTEKGNDANKHGGHKAYNKWKQEESKRVEDDHNRKEEEAKKLNWPQKNWPLILILSAIIFPLITGLILEGLRKPTTQGLPPIQVVRDTVYIYDPDSIEAKLPLRDSTKKGVKD